LLGENPVFQTNFKASPSRRYLQRAPEGCDPPVEPAVGMGMPRPLLAAVSQRGACSRMATAPHAGLSRSCFFFDACINPLVLSSFFATETERDTSLSLQHTGNKPALAPADNSRRENSLVFIFRRARTSNVLLLTFPFREDCLIPARSEAHFLIKEKSSLQLTQNSL